MIASLKRAFRVAAAAAALLTLSPAQAVVYSGAWDPLFGDPFTTAQGLTYNLGWSGTVKVDVPGFCIPTGSAILYTPFNNCGVPKVLEAEVELYKPGSPRSDLATLTFNTSSMQVLGLNFADGALDWIWTRPSSWEKAALPEIGDRYFSLAFLTPEVSPIFALLAPELGTTPAYGGPVLLASKVDIDNFRSNNLSDILGWIDAIFHIEVSNVAKNPPEFLNEGRLFGAGEVTEVPEPGSLALVALALVATGWVARSRRRR